MSCRIMLRGLQHAKRSFTGQGSQRGAKCEVWVGSVRRQHVSYIITWLSHLAGHLTTMSVGSGTSNLPEHEFLGYAMRNFQTACIYLVVVYGAGLCCVLRG